MFHLNGTLQVTFCRLILVKLNLWAQVVVEKEDYRFWRRGFSSWKVVGIIQEEVFTILYVIVWYL